MALWFGGSAGNVAFGVMIFGPVLFPLSVYEGPIVPHFLSFIAQVFRSRHSTRAEEN